MRSIKARTVAALFAAVMAVSAFSGCASGDGEIKKASADAPASGEHSGEKKLDVYVDDNGTPYFYDAEGKKMMLFAVDYEEQSQFSEDSAEGIKADFIYGHYDVSGLSFDIPEGCCVDDQLGGFPTIYKDEEDPNNIDYNNCISIIPAKFMLGYDMDKDKKVDKKFVENYLKKSVENGLYTEYKINATGKGKVGEEDADMYDITVTYKNEEGMPDLPNEKSRNILYITKGKNCYIAAVKVPVDDDATASVYTDIYKSLAASIKLPTEQQTKDLLKNYSMDPSEIVVEAEGDDLMDDGFNPDIDAGTDSEDVQLDPELQ